MDEAVDQHPVPDDVPGSPERARPEDDFARKVENAMPLLTKYAKQCDTELEDFRNEWVARVYPWYIAANPSNPTFLGYAKATAVRLAHETKRTNQRWNRALRADPNRPTFFATKTPVEKLINKEASHAMNQMIAALSDEQKSLIHQRLTGGPLGTTSRSARAQRAASGRLLKRLVSYLRLRFWREHEDESEQPHE